MYISPVMFASLLVFSISPNVFGPYFAEAAFLAMGLGAARSEASRALGLDKITALGSMLFAAPLAAFGAEHLVSARSIAQLVPVWMPWRMFWTYFVGVALIAAALSIVLKRSVRLSATLLGVMFLLFVLMMHVPGVAAHPRTRIFWAIAFRDLAFAGGAWALAGTCTQEQQGLATNKLPGRFATLGRIFIAMTAVFYGVQHFLHPELVPGVPLRMLTPAWIPLRQLWAYLTGAVLLVGGTSLLIGKKTRMAATGIGVVVLLLVLGIYLPIMIATRDS